MKRIVIMGLAVLPLWAQPLLTVAPDNPSGKDWLTINIQKIILLQ